MNNQLLMLKQLGKQLKEWQAISQKYSRPSQGWVRTIRKALGMTAQQLAERIGVARSRVVQLESGEIHDAVTLHTLKKAANAMDCELVYVIVPKRSAHGKNPLEIILRKKAIEIAERILGSVAHTMLLEKQSVEKNQYKEQKDELLKKLLEGSPKKLWRMKK